MPGPLRLIVLIGLVLALGAGPVLADTPEQERIKQLEQENDELRQELAQLRLALSQLKRELREKQADSPDHAEAGEPGDREAEAGENDVKTGEKEKARGFRSTDEIYRSLPDDLRPGKDGWGIVETQSVREWLKTNVTGKQFEARKEIKSVSVGYDTIRRLWKVTLSFEDEKMRYMSWGMHERIYPITLQGDQDFAEAARKKYKAGGTVHVSGLIIGIGWDVFTRHGVPAEADWHPSYCQIQLDDAKIK